MHENDMKVIDNAKNGNKDAMTKLIEDNNGLIWSIVRRFNGRGYDIEDLYQIGTIGFIKAIQRFDTSFESLTSKLVSNLWIAFINPIVPI